ncbi:hypothetical protein HDU87_001167 [Geranomyces variabilis]|uniref:Uncharacterized protein n=1 Tax=Geranomyces variabilis TaxID=109894 RepID=A0AAD5TD74_9FUNG|nr:hypothetical protein HDU87_001167 [Geranomyces variabilis]
MSALPDQVQLPSSPTLRTAASGRYPSALPKHVQAPNELTRRESDNLLENKPFGPETFFFASTNAATYPAFCDLLSQTEPSIRLIHINPTSPADCLLCMAADLGWVGFLFKFVLDYNITFGQGETIVRWHGRNPPCIPNPPLTPPSNESTTPSPPQASLAPAIM